MSDMKNLERAKKQADEAAYKRGYKEGVDVTMWAAIFVLAALLLLDQWLGLF